MHPTERLFVPAAVVSFGTILINISQYGPSHAGQWLSDAVAVLFWFDCGFAILASMVVYLLMYVLGYKPLEGTKTGQVEHQKLHNRTNDSCMDISRLPNAHHRTACSSP